MLTNFKCNHCGCIIKSMFDHHKELCPECNIGFLSRCLRMIGERKLGKGIPKTKRAKEEIINKKLLY